MEEIKSDSKSKRAQVKETNESKVKSIETMYFLVFLEMVHQNCETLIFVFNCCKSAVSS